MCLIPFPSIVSCICASLTTDTRKALRNNHGFKAEPCDDCLVQWT